MTNGRVTPLQCTNFDTKKILYGFYIFKTKLFVLIMKESNNIDYTQIKKKDM